MFKKKYLRITYDGSVCIMEFNEGIHFLNDSDQSYDYQIKCVSMTQEKYDSLEEFQGF